MAAPLKGTYRNSSTGETLQITESDDRNGSFAGRLSGRANETQFEARVNGGYHVANNVASSISISFTAVQESTNTNPEVREAWAGTTDANNSNQLQVQGVRSLLLNDRADSSLSTLGGPFVRQS